MADNNTLMDSFNCTESQGTRAIQTQTYPCAQAFSPSPGSSSGTLSLGVPSLTGGAVFIPTSMGTTQPAVDLDLPPRVMRSCIDRPKTPFARLRRERNEGWVSDGHAGWGGRTKHLPPVTSVGIAPCSEVRPVFCSALLEPIRFKTAENMAGFRDDSDSAGDAAPIRRSYIDQMIPMQTPSVEADEVSDVSLREKVFTYI